MKKNILITGSSSHLGCLIINYLKKNYFLILHSNKKILKKRLGIKIYKANFNNMNSTEKFAKKIVKMNKKIDIIIHLPSKKINIKNFYNYSWSEIINQINIQVRSLHILLSALFIKKKINNNFKLIIITSDILNNLSTGMLDYLCAKSILKYYSDNFNKELKGKFNSYEIRPKMFKSPLVKNIPNYIIEKNVDKIKNIELKILKIIKKIIENKTKRNIFNAN